MKKSRLTTLLTTTSAVTLALALGAPSANAEEQDMSLEDINLEVIEENLSLTDENTNGEVIEVEDLDVEEEVLNDEIIQEEIIEEENIQPQTVALNSNTTRNYDLPTKEEYDEFKESLPIVSDEEYLEARGNFNAPVSHYVDEHLGLVNDLRDQKNKSIDNGTAKQDGVQVDDSYVYELKHDEKLSQIAAWKAKDMAENNYFAHNTPDGERPTEFVKRHLDTMGGNPYKSFGENIAMSTFLETDKSLADAHFTLWYFSKGHRKNMESHVFTHFGYGTYVNPKTGVEYGVQLFGGVHYKNQGAEKLTKAPTFAKTDVSGKSKQIAVDNKAKEKYMSYAKDKTYVKDINSLRTPKSPYQQVKFEYVKPGNKPPAPTQPSKPTPPLVEDKDKNVTPPVVEDKDKNVTPPVEKETPKPPVVEDKDDTPVADDNKDIKPPVNNKEKDKEADVTPKVPESNDSKDEKETPSVDKNEENKNSTKNKEDNDLENDEKEDADVKENENSKDLRKPDSTVEEKDNDSNVEVTSEKVEDKTKDSAVTPIKKNTPPSNDAKSKELQKDAVKTLPNTGISHNESLSIGASLLAMLSGLVLFATGRRKESK